MRSGDPVCFSRAEARPVALFATLADGTQIALCQRCSAVPERARAFVGRFREAHRTSADASCTATPGATPCRAAD